MYILLGYLVVINIVSLVYYANEAKKPTRRISGLLLILLPIIGGSLGAAIANYFFQTEYRELRARLQKFLAFLPPVMFIIQLVLFLWAIGFENGTAYIWNSLLANLGAFGVILIILNMVSFFLVAIRKASYYFASYSSTIISDWILIPAILLGIYGAVLAKILFNFSEDWSTNSTKKIQNFLYNNGMFLIFIAEGALFIYFFFL